MSSTIAKKRRVGRNRESHRCAHDAAA
jgi:hypothetical protein